MNWVGGSRSRFVMKNDAKKQREFFEKRKMQQKLKKMGIPLPASPQGTSSGSMDLVTLFIVNQIAVKKEKKDPPKVAVLSRSKEVVGLRNEPLVLPMSPCSPSQLSLMESLPHSSVHVSRKRKQCLPQGFKYPQLSPVLESAFSDNSAPDYLPTVSDALSPFSSTSSASSGQGVFPLQANFQQRGQTQSLQPPLRCSSPPWDVAGEEQAKFWPLSRPRGVTDRSPWSCGSNYQLKTPAAAPVPFGSPGPDATEARDHAGHQVTFSLNLPEDNEPMLDFILNQPESDEQFEEEVFSGFSSKEYNEEASPDGRVKSKIYLKPQTSVGSSKLLSVPYSKCSGAELCKCAETNLSCPELSSGPMGACEYSPSYSCRESYCSSDVSTDEECSEPCVSTACFIKDQGCHVDTPTQDTQQRATQSYTQITPYKTSQISTGHDQRFMENMSVPECGGNDRQTGSRTRQAACHSSPQSDSSELPQCKRTSSSGTQEAGTQTADNPARQTCDASTQCSLISDGETKTSNFNSLPPPVERSVPPSTTGRRPDPRDAWTEAEPHTAPTCSPRSGGKQSPTKRKHTAEHLPGCSDVNKQPADRSDSRASQRTHVNFFLDGPCATDGRGWRKQDGQSSDEREAPVMKARSDGERKEVTSGCKVNTLAKEADTLQEIADILLMLKQRKKEG